MVLEQIFKEKWIEKKSWHALFLGIVYSIIGIISAKMIFGGNPGLMSVAFTSILLVLSLNNILGFEENIEIREKKFSLRLLLRDHFDIFEIYFFLFIGIFIVYAAIPLLFSQSYVSHLFEPQLAVAGLSDGYTFFPHTSECTSDSFLLHCEGFSSIFINNIIILLVCLVLSFVYGAGSIIFLTWNASVWGVVFGFVASSQAKVEGSSAFVAFTLMMIPILPHMITEALSYLTGAVAGGVISKATIREKLFSKKFMHIVTDALLISLLGIVLVTIAAALETCFYECFVNYSWVVIVLLLAVFIGAMFYHKRGKVVTG